MSVTQRPVEGAVEEELHCLSKLREPLLPILLTRPRQFPPIRDLLRSGGAADPLGVGAWRAGSSPSHSLPSSASPLAALRSHTPQQGLLSKLLYRRKFVTTPASKADVASLDRLYNQAVEEAFMVSSDRRSIWGQFSQFRLTFTGSLPTTATEDAISHFLVWKKNDYAARHPGCAMKATSLHQYGAILRGTAAVLNGDPAVLIRQMIAREAAKEDSSSAPELLPSDLPRVTRRLHRDSATVAVLATKTASRWSDFKSAVLIRLSIREVLILFGTTKSEMRSTKRGKREDHQVIARFAEGEMPAFLVVTLPLLEPTTLTYLDTAAFRAVCHRHDLRAADGRTFTGHSFKQGSAEVLLNLAEKGLLCPSKIAFILKHSGATQVFMSRVSMAYANTPSKRERIARICGTPGITEMITIPPVSCLP